MNRTHRRAPAAQGGQQREWYTIRNADTTDTPAEVLIYDEIGSSWWGGVSAKSFAKDLSAVEATDITVRLNSPGGDVFEGIAILNALRNHKARITVYVDGIAASAASFIAMAGDEIVMCRNAEMMIHDAWGTAAATPPRSASTRTNSTESATTSPRSTPTAPTRPPRSGAT
ncbi:hypothetical protein C7H75_04785 [Prescottella equi]|nr:hypothetical protein C7H75_04785 [Prescottella equi]